MHSLKSILKVLIPSILPLLLLLAACGAPGTADQPSERPNILFIMSDDHAYQAISAYQDHLIQTPNIDRLADEGMLFTNACVTNSICAPSRAVIFTGLHSHLNGKIDNRRPFDTTQVTFPQILQDAGYQTAIFGKLHFGNNPKGFDQFKILPGQGNYYNPDFITKEEGRINVEGYTTDLITDFTLDWLKEEWNTEEPFFLAYWHKAPHRAWYPAERHYREYLKKTFPEPPTLFDDYEGRVAAAEAEMNILEHMRWSWDNKVYPEVMDDLGIDEVMNSNTQGLIRRLDRMNPEQRAAWDEAYGEMIETLKETYPEMSDKDKMIWKFQRYMQDYLACIAAVDEGVGRVLNYLDEAGLAENTLVVYTSDQGFYLGEHGWYDKRFIYDESFKTPLLVRWPAMIAPGSRSTQMVQNLDFAQTILAAAGVEAPAQMQGESLLPLFRGEEESWDREAVYYHYYEYPSVHMVKRHYGIVTQEYKLAHFYYDVDEWELYDRQKDPLEVNNVYDDPAYADVVAELTADLADLRVYYKDSEELDQQFIELYKNR